MKGALISVIVPVYKTEQYLTRCVSSILEQTYSNLEVILVDDGSPDSCPQMCDDFAKKDKRVKVIHQENAGLSAARNAGLDIAQGEYIIFEDSDDWIQKNAIELLYNCSKQNDADIVQGKGILFDNKGEEHFSLADVCGEKVYSKEEAIRGLLGVDSAGKGFRIVAFGKLFNKKLFDHIRFPVGRIYEDEFVMPKLVWEANKYVILDSKIYYYRLSENSIMRSSFTKKKLNVLFVYKDRIKWCDEHGLTREQRFATQIYYYKLIEILVQIQESDIANRDEMKKALKKEIKDIYREIKKTCSFREMIKVELWYVRTQYLM